MTAAAALGVRPFAMHLHHDGVLRPGTRRLDSREALRLHRAGGQLRVLAGSVWLTRTGDAVDYLVESGGTFDVDGDRMVVIEAARADRRTVVHWSPRAKAVAPVLAAAGRALRSALRAARGARTV